MNKINTNNITKNKPILSDTVLIAIFGALWGFMEISLGAILKGIRIPMGGAILTAIACIIFLTGRNFTQRRGSIIMMGTIAAILKVFSVGTVIAGPFMAILIEAFIGEVMISIFGINLFSYVFTSSILTLYTIVHPLISQGLIFGENIFKIYLETFRQIANLFNIDVAYLGWIIVVYAGIHFILGAISGWLAFSLATRVKKEFIDLLHYRNHTQ